MPAERDGNDDRKRDFALWAVRRLRQRGYLALWAGGCVRDLLMGRTPEDYDVATNATPDQVRRVFGLRRTRQVGASFGVIVVLGPPQVGKLEVATFRTEGPYLDGRHPSHVAFATPEEDARRRDFTINGMFYDPIEEKVLDYVGGQEDLRRRIVRAIGDPEARMREDKLRLLRAVRFTAGLDFQLDPATAAAVRRLCRDIRVVSVERITQELRRMLLDAHRRRAVELCHELGLLFEILPELKPVGPDPTIPADGGPGPSDADLDMRDAEPRSDPWLVTLRMLAELRRPSFTLAFATLVQAFLDGNVVRAVCRRLRFSNDEADTVVWLLRSRPRLAEAPSLSLAELRRLLA
ncbi:MAG TPA: CCA tRNA nucleotidyltransferase, partial [Planctomycetaceae bacterium]|nr:CCA tRNA nucleotidyltransferase [Planctomycetaceae bacterium]